MKLLTNKALRASRATFLTEETMALFETDDYRPAVPVDASHPLQATAAIPKLSLEIASASSEEVAMGLLKNHGVLIFASSTKPGGGWRNGAVAQEEDVSLHSTWGYQAEKAEAGFYGDTQGLGPDKVLAADGAWLVHTDQYRLGQPVPAVFIAVAAPNRQVEAVREKAVDVLVEALAKRLRTAFDVWHEKGVETVIAGAIGCGVFRWKGEDSARALRLALESTPWRGRLILAMPDPNLGVTFRLALDSLTD
jgi:uncharacterized protein (TIGR02452 family)